MKTIVSLSDTHNHFDTFAMPPGDLLIHAGDATEDGQEQEFAAFESWLSLQPHAYKIYVPGNHDRLFQHDRGMAQEMVKSAVCLIDELVEIDGLKVYGSPWVPSFAGAAPNATGFMLDEAGLQAKWAQIPEGLDILITHGPALNVRDCGWGGNYGSSSLSERLKAMKAPPKLHFFGHIHDSHGIELVDSTKHCNVAICDSKKQPVNQPTVIEY